MLQMRDMLDELTISRVITEGFVKDFLAAMAVEAVCSTPRMRPIFGGMLLSGRQAAEVALEILQPLKVS